MTHRLHLLLVLFLTSCTATTPAESPDPITASAPKTCDAKSCQTICNTADQMKPIPTAILACALSLACSCGPKPTPVPPSPSVGGQTSTGGASSVGGATGQGGASATGGTTAAPIEFLACNPAGAKRATVTRAMLSGWHRSPDRAKHRRLTVSYSVTAGSSFPKANVATNLDQGNLGSCTGNGTAQCLSTWPFSGKLTEADALKIYKLATTIDPFPGAYPPTDTGSDGASAALAAKRLGYTTLDFAAVDTLEELQVALLKSTCIIGTDWTDHDSSPTACGEMTAGGVVQGGHEPQVAFWDSELKRFGIRNSWANWGNARVGTNDTGYAYWSAGTLQKKLTAGAEIDCPSFPAAP